MELPRPILSLISSVSGQLLCLELELSHSDYQFLGRDRVAFPRLKHLAVSSDDLPPPQYYPVSVFKNAPSLSELSILHELGSISDIPLAPLLTSLELRHTPFETFLDALNRFPRLLHLTANVSRYPAHSINRPITAPHLQSLILHGCELDLLTLPSLRRLDLELYPGPQYPPIQYPVLLSFISRSACTLEHLGIKFHWATPFVAFLETIPSLTSLRVNVVTNMSSFGAAMAANPALLPRLATLAISASYSNFEWLAFLQLLHTRHGHSGAFPGAGAVLTSVQLTLSETHAPNGDDGLRDEWLPRIVIVELERFVAQGLGIRVTYGDQSWPAAVVGEKYLFLC
jgi:hypothetical protein